jgi:hypothetical protein
MSLYNLSALAAVDRAISEAPYFGGEWMVLASMTPCKRLGIIEQTASGSGTLTLESGVTPTVGNGDIQCVATSYLRSNIATVITLAVTGGGSACVATFAPPARSRNQTFHFPRGWATDCIKTTPAAAITAIGSLTSIAGGDANVSFALYELPLLSSYFAIGCTTDKNFNLKGATSKLVDCGMETGAYVKRGKTKVPMLTIAEKFKGFHDGLARLDGGRVTVMLVGVKDGQLTADRIVFTDWIPSMETKLPDGDGEATNDNSEGHYGEALVFSAP